MDTVVQKVPEVLIYEMINGNPIYYKNYRDYLLGTKQIDEITGSSKLQSVIIAELIFLLRSFLGDDYLLFTNELGLQFSKDSWRAADIAAIKKDKVKLLDDKYLEVPPEVVIEIDTKAELKGINNPLGYYQEKTDELLEFGVHKVVWIFTQTEKVMLAQKGQSWLTLNWDEDIEIVNGLSLNIAEIVRKRLS